MSDLWQIFVALGDPRRLTMVERLARGGPQPMVRLCEGMNFTRQAGAKHILVLREAGLVSVTRAGRKQIVSLDRASFHLAEMFMRQMEAGWDDRLASLKASVESGE